MHLRPLNEDTDGAIMCLACERVKTSYLGETGHVLKVAYGTRHACAKAVAIFHVMFCPTSIGLEDIRETHGDQTRAVDAARRHLSRLREHDSRRRLLVARMWVYTCSYVRIMYVSTVFPTSLPPPLLYAWVVGGLTTYTRPHTGAIDRTNAIITYPSFPRNLLHFYTYAFYIIRLFNTEETVLQK